MESIGAGVYELKAGDIKTWYRVIYLSRIDDVIYILHCFEKDSRKTDRRDLRVAKERFSRVRQRIEEQKKQRFSPGFSTRCTERSIVKNSSWNCWTNTNPSLAIYFRERSLR